MSASTVHYLAVLGIVVWFLSCIMGVRRTAPRDVLALILGLVAMVSLLSLRVPPDASSLDAGDYRVYHSWGSGEKNDHTVYSLVQNLGEYPDSAETPVEIISKEKLPAGCFRIDEKRDIRGIDCPDNSEIAAAQ